MKQSFWVASYYLTQAFILNAWVRGCQGWELALLLFVLSHKIPLFKEPPCANHSLKKSNCELIALVALYKRAKYQIVPFSWIVHASLLLICKEWQEQFALVALYKRATVSSLLLLYFKKEWKIKSFIFFWANCDFALSLTNDEQSRVSRTYILVVFALIVFVFTYRVIKSKLQSLGVTTYFLTT